MSTQAPNEAQPEGELDPSADEPSVSDKPTSDEPAKASPSKVEDEAPDANAAAWG